MRKLAVLLMCATLVGCATPRISDPRFEFPEAPVDVNAPIGNLSTIQKGG